MIHSEILDKPRLIWSRLIRGYSQLTLLKGLGLVIIICKSIQFNKTTGLSHLAHKQYLSISALSLQPLSRSPKVSNRETEKAVVPRLLLIGKKIFLLRLLQSQKAVLPFILSIYQPKETKDKCKMMHPRSQSLNSLNSLSWRHLFRDERYPLVTHHHPDLPVHSYVKYIQNLS